MTVIDERAFADARARVLSENTLLMGVGRLSEKSLHRILKFYFEPDEANHEVAYLGSIADIKNGDGIIEIQTAGFDRLVPKLKKFLPTVPVAVVHPIVMEKCVFWFDKDSGELSKQKAGGKRGRITDVLAELYKIRELIPSDNLTVRLVLISAEEFKALDGYGKYKKMRATKIDRIPNKILEIIDLKTKDDYKRLIPEGLCGEFLAKDFDKSTGLRKRNAYYALKFLVDIGLIERCGSSGRAFVYKLAEEMAYEN